MSTTPTYSADETLQKIGRAVWRFEDYKGELPISILTAPALRDWMHSSDDLPVGIDLERYPNLPPELPPKDDEPDNWIDRAQFRLDRCKYQYLLDLPQELLIREMIKHEYAFLTHLGETTESMEELQPQSPERRNLPTPTQFRTARDQLRDRLAAMRPQYLTDLEQSPPGFHASLSLHLILSGNGHDVHYGFVDWLWKAVNIEHPNQFYHPLQPIIAARLKDHNSKPLFDDHKPFGTLHGKTSGTIRHNPNAAHHDISTLVKGLPSTPQLELFSGFDALSQVPRIHVAQHIRGIDLTGRAGQVPIAISLLFEGLMRLEPNQTAGTYKALLDELYHYFFPKARGRIQSFHIDSIVTGLQELVEVGIPYTQRESNSEGLWLPVRPKNLPTISSSPDFRVMFDVETPPDAKGGFLVEKQLIRELRHSTGMFYGYLSFCEYSDRYGNIDPTIPEEPNTDNEGYYLKSDGKRYATKRGKPSKNLFHADLLSQLPRVDNDAAHYPEWSDEDLIRATKIEYRRRWRARDLKYALKQFKELENTGVLTIETLGTNRHLIQPATRHLKSVRAFKKAAIEAKKLRQSGN